MKKLVKKLEEKKMKIGKYDPKKIESKWAKIWEKQKTFKTKTPSLQGRVGVGLKKKFHVLDMFPYPSGEGLHTGHAKIYTGSDVMARFKRLQGYNVLHATGWDAFGLPAEQFAIKMKTNPKIQTKKNTDNFERQMKRIGFSYDWDRTVNTTDPEFYKWTQFIFKQLYKAGLCYESFEPINWCPSCKTGLANEDLEDGRCERCSSVVEKKPIRQWVIKITDYAEKLLSGLDEVGWKENIKDMQRNWIGKSEGAEIQFELRQVGARVSPLGGDLEGADKFIIFTTRPDTLFGCTYCVFAPEHSLVKEYLEKNLITNKTEVEKYISEAKNKSEIERGAEGKEKTGVKLEGVVAINPANQKQVPVYIADYVLSSYGSGAIMAVPAHDVRDMEFAKKYNIPAVQVIAPFWEMQGILAFRPGYEFIERVVVDAIIENEKGEFLMIEENDHGLQNIHFVGGGTDGEDPLIAVKREVIEETGYTDFEVISEIPNSLMGANGFRLTKNKNQKTIGNAYHIKIKSENKVASEVEDGKHKIHWVKKGEVFGKMNWLHHREIWKAFTNENYCFTDAGKLVNSGQFDGMDSEEAKVKITEFVSGKMVTKYKLRDWVFARQRYWGEPFPIVFEETNEKINGKETGKIIRKSYLVADKELPVKLPDVKNYQPTGDGESPLKNIKNWVEVYGFINKQKEFESVDIKKVKKIKRGTGLKTLSLGEGASDSERERVLGTYKGNKIKKFFRETNTMPQWAGSSWYWLRYMDPKNKKALVDKKAEKYWGQVDMYVGGMEHATRHLIYGRFWNRFLYDKKIISTPEPFQKLEAVGLVLGPGGVKMSKRLGNIINPDDICNQFGADTLRTYLSFSSSFHDSFAWDEKAIVGSRRFIERVWGMQNKIGDRARLNLALSELETVLHQTIKKCEEDYEKMQYNTAIAQMMIFVNAVEKVGGLSLVQYINFLKLLSPVAPFVVSEIFENLQKNYKTPPNLPLAKGGKSAKNTEWDFVNWPKWDAKKIQNKNVNIALQINGKLRDTFAAEADIGDEEIKKLAEQTDGYKKWILEVNANIRKIIVVKNKVINIVI